MELATSLLAGVAPHCILLLCMLYVCFRGYKLYRVALFILGFLAGYVLSGSVLTYLGDKVPQDKTAWIMLGAGLVFGALSSAVVNIGIFFAVFHFVRYCLGGPIAAVVIRAVETKFAIPGILIPSVSALISFLAALLLARLAGRFLAPVIRILTGITGGFYAVDAALLLAAALLPGATFLPERGSLIVTAAKLVLAAAGIWAQQTGESGKKAFGR